MITIQRNGIVQTIAVTKHLGTNLKRLEVLLCFDYQNGIIDEEEDLMFVNEPKLFSIGTINLPLETLDIVVVNIIQPKIITKTIDFKVEPSCNFRSSAKTTLDKRPQVSLEDKVYLETYYHHTPCQVQIDETLAKV
jgi:hypothetical protein